MILGNQVLKNNCMSCASWKYVLWRHDESDNELVVQLQACSSGFKLVGTCLAKKKGNASPEVRITTDSRCQIPGRAPIDDGQFSHRPLHASTSYHAGLIVA